MSLSLPVELIFKVIQQTESSSTLAKFAQVCKATSVTCAPYLWRNLVVRDEAILASLNLALQSNSALAAHVESVVFMEYPSYRDIDITGSVIESDDHLRRLVYPEYLLDQLKQSAAPGRSLAVAGQPWGGWEQSMLRSSKPVEDPSTPISCLCLEGGRHSYFDSAAINPNHLHLYGRVSDWTVLEGFGHIESTFCGLPGIKRVAFSVHAWAAPAWCNIFDRCAEYDMSQNLLDKVIIRVPATDIQAAYASYDASSWSRKSIVEFRSWDFGELAS